MSDDESPPNSQETFVMKSSAIDPLNTMFERFLANQTPFGFQGEQDQIDFHPMPYRPEQGEVMLLAEPWRIILALPVDEKRMIVGLELFGDLVLGRGDSRPGRIILNLDPYQAMENGVSREHLMLRPTKTHLFAIDQGSTNGTMINGAPSGRGVATPLKDQDLISLGNFLVQLNIAGKPSTAR